MAKIKLYTKNILEDGTVTVTGTPDTGFPKTRLYDRAISLYWKDTVTEAKTFHVDQAAENESVDFLAIEKHNFSGESMTWEHSTDNNAWTDAVTGWEQTNNNQIVKTISTELTKQYWRITVSSIENPQCSEIFISHGDEFQVDFVQNPVADEIPNVIWNQTVGGIERSTKLGDERKERTYALFLQSSDGTLANFRAAIDNLDDQSKPFYLKDHEGNYWMARLVGTLPKNFITEGHVTMTLRLIEML